MNILQKINNVALILLLLIWPWQTRYFLVQGTSEYLSSSIYISDLVVGLLLVIFIVRFFVSSRTRSGIHAIINHLKIIKPSAINKQIPDQVRDDTCNQNDKVGYLSYFFLGLVPVAILAIAQFLMQKTWPTKWLGLAKHDPAVLGQVVIEAVDGERWLRAYGSFDHPNILGGVMAVALILILINSRKRWGKVESIFTILFSTALFMSFSRTAWLGLVVGGGVYFFSNTVSFRTRSRIRWFRPLSLLNNLSMNFNLILKQVQDDKGVISNGSVKFVTIIFSIFTLLSLIYSPLVFTRISATGRIEQKSINERVSYYTEAKDLFLSHPYLGVGFRNYVPALMELKPGQPAWSYQPVHNTFVLISVELGLIRVIAIIISLWFLIRLKIKDKKLKMGAGVFAFYSLIFTLALFDHWLWSLHVGWLLIGLLVINSVKLNNQSNLDS